MHDRPATGGGVRGIGRLASACRLLLLPTLAMIAVPGAAQQGEQGPTARDRLIGHLTRLARDQTAARRTALAAITTPAAARARQLRVRALLAELVRPERFSGPVRAVVTGRSAADGYGVENLWFESLPGYRVTANLYRPDGAGPFPAIVMQPGHGIDGKTGNHGFAVNFVRAGYVVLSLDIVGEGERIQHYDPEIAASKVGRPTGEHSMAFAQALPGGGHVSRYFIQDGVRAVDYLLTRPEVDPRRIGAFGCSGGGTATAYLAAFDPRIAATATACYVTDYDRLLAPGGPGPQDAEQSIPFFLERGLDLADWIGAAAPRPYAVVSTTADMFPIAGARDAFAEARRFYATLDAADRITMIDGPGGHGNLQPVGSRIVEFFDRWLKDAPTGTRTFERVALGDPARLRVTPTGQLSTAPDGGSTLRRVIARALPPVAVGPPGEGAAARRARLQGAIRTIARTRVSPQDAPPAVRLDAATGGLQALHFDADPDLRVDGLWAPAGGGGRRPTLLLLTAQPPRALSAPGGPIERYRAAGWNVLALEPRGAGGTEEAKSPLTGDWTLLSLRALLVGRTPVGMRLDDAVAATGWLATRPEVDPRRIDVAGTGALAVVALHLGVVDPRIDRVTAEGGILRYRDIVERPLARDAAEIALPGVLTRYDLPDLARALGDRLTLVNPVDVVGAPLNAAEVAAIVGDRPRLIFRSPRDPALPPSR